MKILVTGGSGFIGTNLVDELLGAGHVISNFDLQPPLKPAHRALWKQGDLLDGEGTRAAVRAFAPDTVIHLGGRAECDETTTVEIGYRANTDGTANVLQAIRETPTVKQSIITSSQFVSGPGRLPTHIEDYFPHTVYGQSKVITEQLTRGAHLPCSWTIIRPTNIWGPWHLRYAREFWKVAAKGLYFHPAGKPVVRSYGYVGTVIDQIQTILANPEMCDGQTLYVGDPEGDIYDWANAFCLALSGRAAPRIPRSLLRAAGLAGDMITILTKKPFYITSSRYRSMISAYPTPMEPTFELLGRPSRSLDEGVQKSVSWVRSFWSEDSPTPQQGPG